MDKGVIRTETTGEFLARGGKINKVNVKAIKAPYKRVAKKVVAEEEKEVDMTALPMALKIRYGIR